MFKLKFQISNFLHFLKLLITDQRCKTYQQSLKHYEMGLKSETSFRTISKPVNNDASHNYLIILILSLLHNVNRLKSFPHKTLTQVGILNRNIPHVVSTLTLHRNFILPYKQKALSFEKVIQLN